MVMIENLLTWLKLVPLPNHSNEGVTYAILDRVISRFGDIIKNIHQPTYEISWGVSKV
jgi:Mg2+ and Co2+ transporter CorA